MIFIICKKHVSDQSSYLARSPGLEKARFKTENIVIIPVWFFMIGNKNYTTGKMLFVKAACK